MRAEAIRTPATAAPTLVCCLQVAGKVFRIGHLGNNDSVMQLSAIAGAEMALMDAGYTNFTPGAGPPPPPNGPHTHCLRAYCYFPCRGCTETTDIHSALRSSKQYNLRGTRHAELQMNRVLMGLRHREAHL